VPLSATWEDGGALAALGSLLLVATVLAVPRLPSQPDTSNRIGLLFSGGGGAAALYAVRRARSESMLPEAIAALTRRAVEGGLVLGALVGLLMVLSPGPAERPLANLRAFTGLGVFVGLLVGSREARAVERGKAAEEMRQQREQLDFLTDILGHDVLNKVAVIRGHADLIAETADDSDDREQLATIAREAEEIESLVDEVRVLAGSVESADDLESVALSPVLNSEVATAEESYDVTVETDIGPRLRVRADELLSSLFGNLLRNAAEHGTGAESDDISESAPDVVVTATEADGAVRVRVEDRGPGLPSGPEADVFDPEASGGVGLYIVKTLAERYGGSVRATDADPTGAAFVVTLPAADS